MRSFIAVTAAVALCLAAGAPAQTYTVLHEFGNPDAEAFERSAGPVDGESPIGGVVSDGAKLYGVTEYGGANDGGTIYSMNLDGSGYTFLHSFNTDDDPTAGLALADGVLYGTTLRGGTEDDGTLYSIHTDGSAYTILHSFSVSPDSAYPSPVIVSGDTLYGQTMYDPDGLTDGIVYSIKTDGTGYTVLTSFDAEEEDVDGEQPWGRLLLEDGVLYGATLYGGAYYADAGTLFSLPAAGGAHTTLHSFSGTDGDRPTGALLSDGSRLYGVTGVGGYSYYSYGTMGTVFAVDKDGANFTTLHRFDTGEAGATQSRGRSLYEFLATGLARDGDTLYGAKFNLEYAYAGTKGASSSEFDMGTLFSLKTDGTGYTELYRFDGVINGTGSAPAGTLLLQNGTLYGVTLGGGANSSGVVYSFTLPTTPAPPIDLTPSRTTFFTTDYIAVRANVAAIDTPCVPFVRIVKPDGGALYFVQGKGFTESPTPFLGFPGIVTVPAPIYDYPVFDTLFRGMPIGTYVLEGGALDATRTTDLLNPVYIGTVDRETLTVQ